MPTDDAEAAPALCVSHWLNSDKPITLHELRGKVVLIHAFQMLCPACVMSAGPQAVRIWQHYRQGPHDGAVVVIGLHTVFEHHHVMTPAALEVYLHEFRVPFPVGVDAAGRNGPIPQTLRTFDMQGTPTTLLINAVGRLRKNHFGIESDQQLIADIDRLVSELALR
ncbi:MAG: TlpA family protein disulfide reductase [Betaproteobacteria bacterium]|nr:TlpA family protein disulfide reductase [Betaproteobacteria bacterium]